MFTMFSDLGKGNVTDSSDSEDFDDIESMYEGQARSIFSSLDESIGKIDDFLAFERSFLHGDIVCSVADPSGQLGRVIDIDVSVDIENAYGKTIKDINSKDLLRIRSFCVGDYVVHGSWLGVVDRVIDLVTVLFEDGAMCVIEKPDPAILVPVPPNLLEDSEHVYYPGQRVKGRLPSVFKNAGWLRGEWKSSRRECMVKHVEVQSVYVNWTSALTVGCAASVPPPRCLQHPKGLTLLLPFPHSNWQLGDYCILQFRNREQNHGTGVHGAHEWLLKCGNMLQKEGIDLEQAFVIVKRKVKVDVLWQDGRVSAALDSHALCPVDNIGDHDLWPEDVVLEKGSDEDGQDSGRKLVGIVQSVDAKERTARVRWMNSELDATAASIGKFGEEIVSVYELVEHPDYCYCLGDIVCKSQNQSLEDLKLLSSAPDTLLCDTFGKDVFCKRQIGENCKDLSKSFTSCIGHVSGLKDGAIEVTWANGAVAKVAPHQIMAVDRDEEQASTDFLQNQNVEVNSEECGLEVDNCRQNKNAKKDNLDKTMLCSGNNNCSNYSWETDALSIPRAAIGFLTNIASSIFGSRGSTSFSSKIKSTCSSHLDNDYHLEMKDAVMEDENGSEDLYKRKIEEHQIAAVKAHQLMSGESSLLRGMGGEEHTEVKHEQLPQLRSSEECRKFMKFDISQDYSDHHFRDEESNPSQRRGWLKKISQEWSILEKELPDSIYVRIYEGRADILRAAISGASGTPYHDGLFFFDIFLPPDFPSQPPLVHYISGGLKLNPNLYETGHVCLSLLNTWTGEGSEVWNPASSTILQVLVSLQALVLNAKPYFNEAGYDKQIGKVEGEKNSIAYNENAFLLSCKSMLYLLRKPPKNFEALVEEHFNRRARSMLLACRAYMGGAQVGCVSGDGKILSGGGSSSAGFKIMLAKLFPKLVSAFSDKGIDCSLSINTETSPLLCESRQLSLSLSLSPHGSETPLLFSLLQVSVNDCFVGMSASSSSLPGDVFTVDEDPNHQKRKKNIGECGAFTIPPDEVIQIDDDDVPQNGIIIGGSSAFSMFQGKNEPMVLPHGGEKRDVAKLAESSWEKKVAVLLSDYNLSYLDLDPCDGQRLVGSQPTSTISNDSDEYMGVEEDYEVAYVSDGDSLSPWTADMFAHEPDPSSSAGPSCPSLIEQIEANIARFREFKQFDTVVDHSDNHFDKLQNPGKFSLFNTDNLHPQPRQMTSKEWTRHIQQEWSILEKDLPDTIYVRVYEERMDLLRAVILGAAGTPYHDGLFFFDISFPQDYPYSPPLVHYHSFGHRINPNLYECGKVCLSLLNTWHGSRANSETWIPMRSTVLQVLVSIQGLVLNEKPYFNEPGYERSAGKKEGESKARDYNEQTFLLSVKSMLHLLRNPPKHFESFVAGHFYVHAPYILEACQAYMQGAQVGCLAAGGIQDVDQGDKSCSEVFKASLSDLFPKLVTAFTDNGSDCQKFVPKPKEPRERKLIVKTWD
ncbi:probable ubiquitin-conjugating enzyme E2 24 [Nymphaea colorata]|nr:probable ubiquitin-conjugating enzyme E2 24 [Nymphaea colorata]